MQTTVDEAGRVGLPKALRDLVGITAGPVQISVSGAGLLIEPVASGRLVEEDGRLRLAEGPAMTVDELRDFRLADQR